MLTRRGLNLLGLACCAGLLAYAWYAQGVLRVDPCPLCIFQRVGIFTVGLIFLVAGIHAPPHRGARVYGVLLGLTAALTMAIAARHVWIQHLPADAVPSCGAGLNFLLEDFPLAEVIRKVLTGSGECHEVNWTFLGLAMPTWVLLSAGALGVLGVYANFRARPR
ncbi:MAG: disulfide bond formation protein B [Steroidobacteraceae bacterium]